MKGAADYNRSTMSYALKSQTDGKNRKKSNCAGYAHENYFD